MIKIKKILAYISVALILIVIAAFGKNSIISEGKKLSGLSTKAEETMNVFLDDEPVAFTDKPVIKGDKVYMSLNEISRKLVVDVDFIKSNRIVIKNDDKNLVIDTKERTAISEKNETFFIDYIDEGKNILLSLDIIANHFGYNVSEVADNTIKIYKNTEEEKDLVEPEEVEVPEEEKPKVVYLTFDDGPNVNTPGILDVLKAKDVKATFFMLGSSVLSHPDMVKRVADEGHAVGVHSMTHNFKTVYASPQSFVNEMNGVNDLLYEILGRRSQLLRPPYGSMPYMKEEFRDLTASWGYRTWDWDIDSKDSVRIDVTAQEIYMHVTTQMANRKEAVILFHDKASTLQALPSILDYLIENGYEIKELDSDMTPMNFWKDTRKFS